jgi:glutamate dehydrogenase
VKARSETHAQVGDRANDALRVDGRSSAARSWWRAATLAARSWDASSSRARRRINTDAIDNSAGVDTSDHEVNIKILLGLAIGDGELTEKQRNTLLAEMTDDVAALVLRDNYFQTQVLSVTGRIAPRAPGCAAALRPLPGARRPPRAGHRVPADRRGVHRAAHARARAHEPERAVMLAYAKMWLYDELLASTLPDDPWVATALARYFPGALAERYASYMERHPLKREIIATHVTNSMLNRVGSTFVHRLMESTGARLHEVVRAYLLSREVFGFVALWKAIEALDNKVDDALAAAMLVDMSRELERGTTWFLRSRRLSEDMAATIDHFAPRVEALAARLPTLLDEAGASACVGRLRTTWRRACPKRSRRAR